VFLGKREETSLTVGARHRTWDIWISTTMGSGVYEKKHGKKKKDGIGRANNVIARGGKHRGVEVRAVVRRRTVGPEKKKPGTGATRLSKGPRKTFYEIKGKKKPTENQVA